MSANPDEVGSLPGYKHRKINRELGITRENLHE